MNDKIKIKVKRLKDSAKLPSKAHEDDAAYDLYAAESVDINPLEVKTVDTGLVIQPEKGYYTEIWPRSGMAVKKVTDIYAGILDQNFRGSVRVAIYNGNAGSLINTIFSKTPINTLIGIPGALKIREGDRIAQLIIREQIDGDFEEVDQLEETDRGQGGFGSTGV